MVNESDDRAGDAEPGELVHELLRHEIAAGLIGGGLEGAVEGNGGEVWHVNPFVPLHLPPIGSPNQNHQM